MTSSNGSSPAASRIVAPRKQFRLTGPSPELDPRRDAFRRDLADIALADRVFAQHYVVPAIKLLAHGDALLASPGADATVLCTLPAGARFDLLDIEGDWAWGRGEGFVGYVRATALTP